MTQITINGITFKSRAKAAEHTTQILNKYGVGQCLEDDDKDFVLALLQMRDPETVKEKTGIGILDISPMYARGFTGRTFCLDRCDGTITDFSFRKSLYPDSDFSYVKKAARWEVRDQIDNFKLKQFSGICAITGESVTMQGSHVDHIPPETFDVLFAEFLRLNNRAIDSIKAQGVGDFLPGTMFLDRDLADKWKAYHRDHAKLRIVSVNANLTLVEKIKGDYGK